MEVAFNTLPVSHTGNLEYDYLNINASSHKDSQALFPGLECLLPDKFDSLPIFTN